MEEKIAGKVNKTIKNLFMLPGCCWNPQTPPGVDLPYCFTENTGASAYNVGYSEHYKNGDTSSQPLQHPEIARGKVTFRFRRY